MPDFSFLPSFLTTPLSLTGSFFYPLILWGGLFCAALVDLWRGRVPLLCLIASFALMAYLSFTHETLVQFGVRTMMAVSVYALLWGVNELYFLLFRRDAYGMGDAKWSAVVAAGFGLGAVAGAWIYGAWLALIWMGARFIIGLVAPSYRGRGYVHFVPFLFAGLVCYRLGARLI